MGKLNGHRIRCERCDGKGVVASWSLDGPFPEECPDCGGSGLNWRYQNGSIASYYSGPFLGRAALAAKSFPTLYVASTITGIGLCNGMKFSDMQEIASHLFGASIWTHELIHEPTKDAYVSEGYRQFPDMPTPQEAQTDYQAAARKAISAYGDSVEVQEGSRGRRESPVDTLGHMVPPEKIIVVKP